MSPRFRYRIVHDDEMVDFGSVRVTLFRGETNVCGWYLSPIGDLPVAEAYVPKSANMIASTALIRAAAISERLGSDVWVIDLERLWDEAWGR